MRKSYSQHHRPYLFVRDSCVMRKIFLLCAVGIIGGSAARAQQQGLETPWDVRKILVELNAQTDQLKPLLAQLNPQQWANKGASTTYIQQWQGAQKQLSDVLATTQQLGQKTESLTLALDTYFRLEALETTARSLTEGAQRYGDRATADRLSAYVARSFTSRQRLRDYLEDLATSTEQNFKIADEEAQRCRGMISK
jgi:hypothetical protein